MATSQATAVPHDRRASRKASRVPSLAIGTRGSSFSTHRLMQDAAGVKPEDPPHVFAGKRHDGQFLERPPAAADRPERLRTIPRHVVRAAGQLKDAHARRACRRHANCQRAACLAISPAAVECLCLGMLPVGLSGCETPTQSGTARATAHAGLSLCSANQSVYAVRRNPYSPHASKPK
jgi:hypothetical protein